MTKPTQKEIKLAKESEPTDYVTVCQKLLLGMIKKVPISLSFQDPDISDLDKMILPHVMAGNVMGMIGGEGIICDKKCPGYIPTPVEDFSLTTDESVMVRCQRLIPKSILDRFDGWEDLRETCA